MKTDEVDLAERRNGEGGLTRLVGWLRFALPAAVLLYGVIDLAFPEEGDKATRVPILGVMYLVIAVVLYLILRWLHAAVVAESVADRFTRVVDDLTQRATTSARQAAGYASALARGDAFAGVVIQDGLIRFDSVDYPITSDVCAQVEMTGQILQRFTVTRLALLGPFGLALPKSKDRRELFLTVEGRDFAFVVPVDAASRVAARNFAARINTLSKQLGVTTQTGLDPSSADGSGDVERSLRDLQRLLDNGLITPAEFDQKRTEILDRL